VKTASPGATNMTVGNPYRLILNFSLPLLVGNIFQQLYFIIDCIIVGNVVGDKALAAVGTGFPITFMMSSLFIGIGMGATIIIAQYLGAGNMDQIRETVQTIYTALILGAIPLSLIGIVSSVPLLRLMNVPNDGTMEMAQTFMFVIFAGMIGNLGYNINAGILQGLGDSRTSMLFLIISTIINIILDLLFTATLGWGVFGVAFATIIAEFCSWIFGIYFINKRYPDFHIRLFHFHFNRQIFLKAIKLGIPAGLQQAMFAIGSMVMQALVNSYGSSFMAGFNGANKIDTFAFMPIQSFSNAVTTYVGQNVGASFMDRVKKGTRAGLVLAVGSCLVIGGIVYLLSPNFMRLFSPHQDVIDAGVAYLHDVLPFYFLLALLFILNAVVRGAGATAIPTISTFVSLWIARIPAAYWIASVWGRDAIYYSYAIGWLLGLIISFVYYITGRWKTKSVVSNKGGQPEKTD